MFEPDGERGGDMNVDDPNVYPDIDPSDWENGGD